MRTSNSYLGSGEVGTGAGWTHLALKVTVSLLQGR